MHPASIGPFRIERELGRGGMGEVYLATDTRLDRQVAIKALPAHLAQDPDRLARFQREAKVLASLNHPGIGAIYGVEESNGHVYLILEYVAGQTLADQLAKGPIQVDEALGLAVQIAQALEAAHEKGIVHRDLKPSNVMVTADGVLKVLDFGLARTGDEAPASSITPSLADSPTITSPARIQHSPTIPGAILGTAGYMSPEQARGKQVDKRSDIFSFGCVVYEMLSGAAPFGGETVADAIGATLHKESNLNLLPPETPSRVRALLENCLAKDRRNRLHDIGDARIELERALSAGDWSSPQAVPSKPRARLPRVIAGVAGAMAMLALGAGLWSILGDQPSAAPPVRCLTVDIPDWLKVRRASLTPDGRNLIMTGTKRDVPAGTTRVPQLYVRALDRFECTPLEGTAGVTHWRVSRDSKLVRFTAPTSPGSTTTRLAAVPVDGSAPAITLTEFTEGGIAAYSFTDMPNGDLVVTSNGNTFVRYVKGSSTPSAPITASTGGPGLVGFGFFASLPNNRLALVGLNTYGSRGYQSSCGTIDLETGHINVLVEDAGWPSYSTTGHLVFSRGAAVLAAPFDAENGTLLGTPVAVWGGLLAEVPSVPGWQQLSGDGTLLYLQMPSGGMDYTVSVLGADGTLTPWTKELAWLNNVTASPDGKRVVFQHVNARNIDRLAVSSTDHADLVQLNAEPNADVISAAWSPDSKQIAYMRIAKDDADGIYLQSADSGPPRRIFKSDSTKQMFMPTAWMPDGASLLITMAETGPTPKMQLMRVPIGSGEATIKDLIPVLPSQFNRTIGRISSDGRVLVFASDESGKLSSWVVELRPDGSFGRPVQVKTAGVAVHQWGPDPRTLYVLDERNRLQKITVSTEPQLSVSAPVELADFEALQLERWTPVGGDRFVVNFKAKAYDSMSALNIVLNFNEVLKQKVPVGK